MYRGASVERPVQPGAGLQVHMRALCTPRGGSTEPDQPAYGGPLGQQRGSDRLAGLAGSAEHRDRVLVHSQSTFAACAPDSVG
jgi:hypothetical protein